MESRRTAGREMQVALKQNHYQVWQLQDLRRVRIAPGRSCRKTARFRIFDAIVGLALPKELVAQLGHGQW